MEKKNIYESILLIAGEIGAISKNKNNAEQHYKYRSIDQFYNAVSPLFAKFGVFTVPEVLTREEEHFQTKSGSTWNRVIQKVQYTFYASDGSSIKAVVTGEGSDSGDKGSNKALAAAHKYALMQVLCVATEDIEDADATTSPEIKKEKTPHDIFYETLSPDENKALAKQFKINSRGKFNATDLSEMQNFVEIFKIKE